MDAQKLVSNFIESQRTIAQAVVPNTLGEAVLALHAQGLDTNREALLKHLLMQADGCGPNDLHRLVAEAAAQRLGWEKATPG